jgi:hypothetical protein
MRPATDSSCWKAEGKLRTFGLQPLAAFQQPKQRCIERASEGASEDNRCDWRLKWRRCPRMSLLPVSTAQGLFFQLLERFFFKKILRMEFSDFHRAIDLDLLNPNVDELLRT